MDVNSIFTRLIASEELTAFGCRESLSLTKGETTLQNAPLYLNIRHTRNVSYESWTIYLNEQYLVLRPILRNKLFSEKKFMSP
jgi:hypothetical protein